MVVSYFAPIPIHIFDHEQSVGFRYATPSPTPPMLPTYSAPVWPSWETLVLPATPSTLNAPRTTVWDLAAYPTPASPLTAATTTTTVKTTASWVKPGATRGVTTLSSVRPAYPKRVGFFMINDILQGVPKVGMTLCLAEIEKSLRQMERAYPERIQLVPIPLQQIFDPHLLQILDTLDVLFCNCGPVTSLLMWMRWRNGMKFRIVRDVQTTGWAPYAFQEFVARAFARPGDRCLQMSEYASKLWVQFRGSSDDVVFHPMLDKVPPTMSNARPPTRVGFFSRVNCAKGAHYLPRILDVLLRHGWPLKHIDICGSIFPPENLAPGLQHDVSKLGMTITIHGDLPFERTQSIMANCDLVLFPSIASVESCGQVVVEALQHGCRVIASDYGVARDCLAPEFLIPFKSGSFGAPESGVEHAWARLDLDGWVPPSPENRSCLRPGTLDVFVRQAEHTFSIIEDEPSSASSSPTTRSTGASTPPPMATSAAPVTFQRRSDDRQQRVSTAKANAEALEHEMHIFWEQYVSLPPEVWCAQVWERICSQGPKGQDLLRSDGVFQWALSTLQFSPAVALSVTAVSDKRVMPSSRA